MNLPVKQNLIPLAAGTVCIFATLICPPGKAMHEIMASIQEKKKKLNKIKDNMAKVKKKLEVLGMESTAENKAEEVG